MTKPIEEMTQAELREAARKIVMDDLDKQFEYLETLWVKLYGDKHPLITDTKDFTGEMKNGEIADA